MEPLSQKYRELIIKMMAHSHGEAHVGEHNVHQVGNRELLPFIDKIVEENLLPGSEIRHAGVLTLSQKNDETRQKSIHLDFLRV